jgi:ATP-dependent DNA ligase
MFAVQSDLAPMEARSGAKPPVGDEWCYEPKWDGFRCLVFRDGDRVDLRSKAGQPLGRYFPELVAAVSRVKARRFVLDGEIVIVSKGRFSFDDLLQRIHPAASRIAMLSEKTPATAIIFDLLADEKRRSLMERPLRERRKELERFFKSHLRPIGAFRLSPATTELSEALEWWKTVGGNLDGIIAKRLDLNYRSGLRDGMVKVKHRRTAECVVGGFRYASEPGGTVGRAGKGTKKSSVKKATLSHVVGSLLLGLFDEAGVLHHVGFTSSIARADRARITKLLKANRGGPGFTGQAPGGPSRWSTERSSQWEPLKPVLVVEVEYDHFTGKRFRHGTKLLRWRPDKSPGQCTFDQVKSSGGKIMKLLRP